MFHSDICTCSFSVYVDNADTFFMCIYTCVYCQPHQNMHSLLTYIFPTQTFTECITTLRWFWYVIKTLYYLFVQNTFHLLCCLFPCSVCIQMVLSYQILARLFVEYGELYYSPKCRRHTLVKDLRASTHRLISQQLLDVLHWDFIQWYSTIQPT